MTINAVKNAIKSWMKDGFVMVELKYEGGFGNIYKDIDDALESVEHYNDFILYNPKPCPTPDHYWMALVVKSNPHSDIWTSERMRGDGKGKRTKKIIADLIANYDAIVAGTYKYVAPVVKEVKKRIIPQISLQAFLVSQGFTKEMWEKSTHRYTWDKNKYLEGKTEEEKKAYDDLFSIDEVIYTHSISKKTMMSAVKYKYRSLFADYNSSLYCGATLWYENGDGYEKDIAWPAYDEGKPVLKYKDLKYVKGDNYKGCYGRFDGDEEGLFEYSWEDLADYMVDKEGLKLKDDGTLIIYDHNCSNGDQHLKELMWELDDAA